MAHRNEVESLRAKAAALELERDALAAKAANLEAALRIAETRIAELEVGLGRAGGETIRAIRGAQAAAARAVQSAKLETDRAWRVASSSIATGVAPQDESFGPRTAKKRLRDAVQFASEGRSREALQIVLSVQRSAPCAEGARLLGSRVYCPRCRANVPPPAKSAPQDAHARFLGGRCPTCAQGLDLAKG